MSSQTLRSHSENTRTQHRHGQCTKLTAIRNLFQKIEIRASLDGAENKEAIECSISSSDRPL